MLVKDILWSARFDYLDDAGDITTADQWYAGTNHKPLWPDDALLRHLNTALNEWCKETGCIRDHLSSFLQILIQANMHTYAMDSRITEIHAGYLDTGAPVVYPKSETWLINNYPAWMRVTGSVLYLLPDYDASYFRTIYYPPSNLGYWTGSVTFTGATKTIAQTGANFSTNLVAGNQVVIYGTTLNGTTAVPATFTVVTASANSFTVSETVSNEVAASTIIRKVTDTLRLSVSRLPLNQLTLAGIATETPEIRSDYHAKLIHGICREAYSKQDSQTLDVAKAKEHRVLFENEKLRARAERDWLRASETTMKPHPGAI